MFQLASVAELLVKDASVATCSQVPSRRTHATQMDFGKLHAATKTTSYLVSMSTQTDGGGIELLDSNSDVHSCDWSTCSDALSNVGSIDLASNVSGSDSEDVEDTEGWTDARSCQLNICLAYVDSIKKLVGFCPLCGLLVLPFNVQLRFQGTMLTLSLECLHRCSYQWTSQSTLSSKKESRSGLGDLELASSAILCGSDLRSSQYLKVQVMMLLLTLSE